MKFRGVHYFFITIVFLATLWIWYADDGYKHSNYYGQGTTSFTFINNGECKIKINGDISDSLENNFKELLKESVDANCKSYELTLKSHGVNIWNALQLGEVIRDKKMTTIVVDYCKSACLYLFISGETRVAHKNSVLGMHQAIDYKSKECINPKLHTKSNSDFFKGLLEFSQEMLGDKTGKFFSSKENIAGCREMLEVDNQEFFKEGVINKLIED
jgi:hypothetical protein